ncbi:MAG: hypothetical protein ABSE56_11890 [Bryobacteraceae bacterium]
MCRWILALLAAGTLWAQENVVSTSIFSEPPGVPFTVDGQTYTGPVTFFWPEHSTHVLGLPQDRPADPNVRYEFQEWRNSDDVKMLDGPTIAITVSADIPYYKAIWKVSYTISVELDTASAPFSCELGPQWGKLYVNVPATDSCYATSQVIWGESGKTVQAQVYTPPGFAFVGWFGRFTGVTASTLSFVLDGPTDLHPHLAPAVRITLVTVPPGLQVFADRQAVFTPIAYDWAEGSQHAVGVASLQFDATGGAWVFDSWSDGGAEYHDYNVGQASGAVTLAARFVPGVPLTVRSSPAGLKLTVDGLATTQATFIWGLGSRHTISAPAEQTDSAGRHYLFRSWSGGGPATQEVTVGPDTAGWIATYEPLNSLTVRADPSEVTLTVDGAACQGGCTVWRSAGAEVAVSGPASLAIGDATRVQFQSWSDGVTTLSRSVKLNADQQTLVAVYPYFYLLAASSDPEGGATFLFAPASSDGFFAVGTSVAVTAQPRAGFRFRFWEGDLSGGLSSGTVKVSGPRWVRAVLEQVPYIAPTGVRNAAADTPELGLAPGSIIAIYGSSLAPTQAAGPRSPLVQTLADVTVRLADRILPLFFVSPEQINAQLPSGLTLGDYTLIVHWEGHAEVKAGLRVVRNAPGLFTQPVGALQYALAIHANGALVTPEEPARPRETITLFGTGFGPYRGNAPDGFAVPETLTLPLADPVKILAGDLSLDPVFAGAAQGEIGVVVIRFQIPDGAASPMELLVTANGKRSNTVVIPVGP